MIPHLYLAGAVAAATLVGGFTAGWKVNSWRHDSQALAIEKAAAKAGESATQAATKAIQSLRPVYTTINKGIEREFRNEVRYTSADCSHTPESWRLLDSAYQAAGGEPFSGGTGVPVAAAAPRSDFRRNDTRAD